MFNDKSILTSATSSPIIPFAVNFAYSPVAVPLPSISTALPSSIPNVNAFCFAFHVEALAIYPSATAVPVHAPVTIVPTAVNDDVTTPLANSVPVKSLALTLAPPPYSNQAS